MSGVSIKQEYLFDAGVEEIKNKKETPYSGIVITSDGIRRLLLLTAQSGSRQFARGAADTLRAFLRHTDFPVSEEGDGGSISDYEQGVIAAKEIITAPENNGRMHEASLSHPYRAGEPNKLTRELLDAIKRDLQGGYRVRSIAERAGITEKTFYLWLNRGAEGRGKMCEELYDEWMIVKQERTSKRMDRKG